MVGALEHPRLRLGDTGPVLAAAAVSILRASQLAGRYRGHALLRRKRSIRWSVPVLLDVASVSPRHWRFRAPSGLLDALTFVEGNRKFAVPFKS